MNHRRYPELLRKRTKNRFMEDVRRARNVRTGGRCIYIILILLSLIPLIILWLHAQGII